MNKPSIITAIAVEAISELETATNYMDWLDTLNWAIKRTLADGNDHHAERLADVAQYLAGDYRETLISNAHQDNAVALKVGGIQ